MSETRKSLIQESSSNKKIKESKVTVTVISREDKLTTELNEINSYLEKERNEIAKLKEQKLFLVGLLKRIQNKR